MKRVQSQLKTVAKSLASLANKIEKMSEQVGAVKAPKKPRAAAKKTAARGPKKKAAAAPRAAASKQTVLDKVYGVITKSRNGATIAGLKSKTGLESRQLSNALYKLSKKGRIKAKSRGVYIKS